MSRLFKKSKKSLVILLTIAFVMSIAAVPAFASTSYDSLTAPTVPDGDYEKLGTMSIEIDPIVDDFHEAWVEVGNERGDQWDIEFVTVTAVVYEGTAPGYIEINETPITVGDPVTIDDDSFVISTDAGPATENIEIWLEFTSVDVEDTGNIYAFFTKLEGQLEDGDALIGRARAGELEVIVRDATSFVTEGDVELRIIEDLPGTWENGKSLKIELPRFFRWINVPNEVDDDDIVFGDVVGSDFDFDTGRGGRDLEITYTGDGTDRRSAFDFTVTVEVEDDERAAKGDIVAALTGDYDVIPDEIIVGVFGDFDITLTPEDIETVYAGKTEQAIADITIEEDVATSIIAGRILTLTLPEWAAWMEESVKDFEDDHRGLELSFRDIRQDGRQLRLDVEEVGDRNDPATLELEDFEIALDTIAEGDVVVDVGGTAAVFGEVTVAEAVSPVIMQIDPTYVESGRSGQEMGAVYLTEAYAGAFEEGDLILRHGRHIQWDAGHSAEVVEGDIDLGSTARADDSRNLVIPVDVESDEASTIRITGNSTVFITAPTGANNIVLIGDSVRDTTTPIYDLEDNGKTLDEVFAELAPSASGVICYVDEEPVLDVTEVVMWIGLTTYTVNGEAREMDVAPFIENDRTFVPVSFIAAEFGLEADWGPVEGLTEWVTFECEDMDILVEIEIGSPYITVTEEGVSRTVTSDVAAQIVGDRTYLPLRAVGEIFGATFDWGPKETLTEWVSFTMMN